MQVDRKVLEQALEALEFMADEWGFTQKANRPERWQAISALQAALQPIIEPEIKEDSWHGLTDEERDYFKACGFVGVSRVEEVLRAKNSTLACIPAVPPGLKI
jgi:hypothetical protein